MMKLLKLQFKLTLALLLIISLQALSQPHTSGVDTGRFYYGLPFNGNLGIRFINNGKTKSTIYEGAPSNEHTATVRNIIIDGNCDIELADIAINPQNAASFRYRVRQADGVQPVAWGKPSVFLVGAANKYKYAYLGRFGSKQGQSLKVEIFELFTNGVGKPDVMQISWNQIYPGSFAGIIEFATQQPHVPAYGLASVALDAVKGNTATIARTNNWNRGATVLSANTNFIETKTANDIKFRLGDSLQNISFHLFRGGNAYFYNVGLRMEVNGKTDSMTLGQTNENFDLYKDLWNHPGKYTISFTPKIAQINGAVQLFPKLTTSISFTVLPPLHIVDSIPLQTVYLILLVVVATGGCIFVMYRASQKKIFTKEAQKKQAVTLQLQAIRQQLNPHFVFNALAGIQNLMNKKEIENANKYLIRFARLTRNILDDGQSDLTTIEHEIAMLTDYLQMEQMRFGFAFSIEIDDNDIDQQIEIPAMLLQPFAENAVKHGVSSLKEKGVIVIGIALKQNDLVLSVQDNGKGFTSDTTTGVGIKLCEERIRLLNSIYKNATIVLRKNWDKNGVLITIEMQNWV